MALLGQQGPISLEELPHFRPAANRSAFFVDGNKLKALDSKALRVEKETWEDVHCKAKMLMARWSSPRATPAPALWGHAALGVTHPQGHLPCPSQGFLEENVFMRTANCT